LLEVGCEIQLCATRANLKFVYFIVADVFVSCSATGIMISFPLETFSRFFLYSNMVCHMVRSKLCYLCLCSCIY